MAGLLIAISFVLFAIGFLAGALLVIAVGINAEDQAARRRLARTQRVQGSVLLHEEPQGQLLRGVRRLTGAGYRSGPIWIPDDERRRDW